MNYEDIDKIVNRILTLLIIIVSFLFGISMDIIDNVASQELKIIDDTSIPVEIQELITFIESKNNDNNSNEMDLIEKSK